MKQSEQEMLKKEIFELQQKKLEKMRKCHGPYSMNFLGKEIMVYPNVFYPGADTELIVNTVTLKKDKVVLELSSGTGVISLFLAYTAKHIVATDINSYATENITANVKKLGLKNVEVVQCDLFPKVDFMFDVIVINPPYSDFKAEDIVEKSMWDKDHATTKRFLREAKGYIKSNGIIFLSWANFADFKFIEWEARNNGYTIKQLSESRIENKVFRVYELKCNNLIKIKKLTQIHLQALHV